MGRVCARAQREASPSARRHEARLAAEAQAHKRRLRIRNGVIVLVVAGIIVGIAFAVSSGNNNVGTQSKTSTTLSATQKANARLQAQANTIAVRAGCPKSPTSAVNTQHYSAAPAMTIDTSKLYSATFDTTAGTFNVALDAKSAPITVNNFVFLAGKGYYKCNVVRPGHPRLREPDR